MPPLRLSLSKVFLCTPPFALSLSKGTLVNERSFLSLQPAHASKSRLGRAGTLTPRPVCFFLP